MMFRGPGDFLADVYVKAGDTNTDGKLSQAESKGMFDRWAGEWDGNHDGSLDAGEIGEGFGKLLPMPPGFGGGGPGRPPGGGPGRPPEPSKEAR